MPSSNIEIQAESQMPTPVTEPTVNFAISPDSYHHWKLEFEGRVARLILDVNETATVIPGYELKLNSYDLGVDIELYDAVQRLRFEHPEVAAVVISSNKPRIFSAGANIRMLAQASPSHKVNFCKFTNETRNSIEDATENSGQTYICAINGIAAGGGYELALACQHITLVDDGSTTVALPELPLLAVLPGTGGLTRLVDKRKVRRDHADFLCTTSEGIKGQRALDWNLVDELAAGSSFNQVVAKRAGEFAASSHRPTDAQGIRLTPLNRKIEDQRIAYDHLSVNLDRPGATAYFTIYGPREAPPGDPASIQAVGDSFWPLAFARELDDAILHLRLNETEVGTWVFRTLGDNGLTEATEQALWVNREDWLAREIILYLKRTLQRLDVSSRSLITLIEPGSCFIGSLLELALASDRTYMLNGSFEDSDLPPAFIGLTELNLGPLAMINGQGRLENRLRANSQILVQLKESNGGRFDAAAAEAVGLVTFTPDDLDWEDEVRLAIEERASFSPDALTGMEASLRFSGPETMQSKIFGRLSAWQNWIFQRPNASGEEGALNRYGSGRKSAFDKKRV